MTSRDEAQPRVERERGGVRLLGVDPTRGDVAAAEPVERVRNEVNPESEPLPVGVHGQALEVALGAGPAGDCETNDVGVTNHTKTGDGRGVDRFIQPVAVELPERLEGLPVDVKDRINVAAMTSAEPSGPARAFGQRTSQVMAQEMQGFVFGEAIGSEHVALGGANGGGDDGAEAVRSEMRPDALEGRGGERRGTRERHEIGEVVTSSPAPGPDSGRVDGQCIHPHAGSNDTPSGPRGTLGRVLLLVSDERCLEHTAGTSHPERPDRLRAAMAGVAESGVVDAVAARLPRLVTDDEICLVHDRALLDQVVAVDAGGGGRLDPDTVMSAGSLLAARLAAGSVLTAVEGLQESEQYCSAFCVVRPPGHHATPTDSMGFCLFNSVAIAAATLADAGERVAIVDIDAHHGNGTQDIFYNDPRVLFASIHQSPLYPGTGMLDERGSGVAVGTTINVPLPPGATGDIAWAAVDDIIIPAIEAHRASWLLISAGFDGHRADPITELSYSSADMADLVGALAATVAPGRVITVLEGGYDLDAVRDSSAAVTAQLVGERIRPEPPTSGGPGIEVVRAARDLHRDP